MKLILEVKDSKAGFVLELLGNLSYVKTGPLVPEKDLLISEIKEAVEQLKLVRAGKLKTRKLEDFLSEL